MGRWLDSLAENNSGRAASAISAKRSDSPTAVPQNYPEGADVEPNGTNGTSGTNGTEGAFINRTTPLGEVAAKSRLAPTNLSQQDWRQFFGERAGLIEYVGGTTRVHAERLAYEGCVTGLSWCLPGDWSKNQCAACGKNLGPQGGITVSDKALVCDATCHQQHRAEQRRRAVGQLVEWAIERPK